MNQQTIRHQRGGRSRRHSTQCEGNNDLVQNAPLYLTIHLQTPTPLELSEAKRKKESSDITPKVLSILAKLDKQADARMEDRERKQKAELEENRQEQERRMQVMFGFLQQVMA